MSLQPLVAFEETPTSKRVTTIENKLTRELNSIVTKIRTYINPLQPINDIENKFKPLYEQQVYDVIRAAATDSYQAGVQYVTTLPIFKNLHSYLLAEDLDIITRLVDEFTSRFWGRVAITTTKGKDKIFGTIPISKEGGIEEPAPTFLSQRYIVEIISIGVTNTALNLATIAKMRHYAEKARPINITIKQNKLVQFATTLTEDELLKRGGGIGTLADLSILAGLISTTANVQVVWLTRNDERVCPICRPLHGNKWSLFDPTIPIPPFTSHQRCRCRLVIITK
jgi:hypothetical protein